MTNVYYFPVQFLGWMQWFTSSCRLGLGCQVSGVISMARCTYCEALRIYSNMQHALSESTNVWFMNFLNYVFNKNQDLSGLIVPCSIVHSKYWVVRRYESWAQLYCCYNIDKYLLSFKLTVIVSFCSNYFIGF